MQVRSAGGRLELRLPGIAANALAFSPDDQTLFTAGNDGVVRAWDLDGGDAVVSQVAMSTRKPIAAGDSLVGPDAAELAVDSWQSWRSLVDLHSGRTWRLRDDHAGWPLANGEPDGAAWRPDGSAYAVGGTDLRTRRADDGLVEIFDTRGQKLGQVTVPSPVAGLSYSGDGTRLLVAELSGRVDVLDGSSLGRTGTSIPVGGPACCLAAATQGSLAAVIVASDKAGIESAPDWNRWAVVDTRSGRTVNTGTFEGHKALDVTLSPDGRRMAVAMADGTMRLLDPATGDQVNSTVARSDAAIYRVAFNDDGTTIVSSAGDALTLWDGATGKELESLPLGHAGDPMFVDNGARVLLGTGGAVSFTWRFGAEGIHRELCRAAGRNLTAGEWATYLPGRPYEKTCPRYG